jgi:hypothetical protein
VPKLLLFAPCEKVLVDESSKSLTLIAVLQEIHYKVPPGASLPTNAGIPLQWSVVTLWHEEPADAGVEFEQRLALATHANQILFESVSRWRFEKPNQRMIAHVSGFPASGGRRLNLNLSYRVALARDWIDVASFPLEVMQDVL